MKDLRQLEITEMIEFFDNIDSTVFLFFNGMRAPFLDTFMMLFTDRFIWVPFYVMLAGLLFRGGGWKAGTLYLAALIIAITLTDQTCASIIRPIAVRMRPSNLENPLSEFAQVVNDYRGGDYGFPSCHSANSFALAVFISLFYRRKTMAFVMFIWALLNSYTRLYLGVHYPGDLIVGAAIGCSFGFICYIAAQSIQCRWPRILKIGNIAADTPKAITDLIIERNNAPLFELHRGTKNMGLSYIALVWVVPGIILAWIILQSML